MDAETAIVTEVHTARRSARISSLPQTTKRKADTVTETKRGKKAKAAKAEDAGHGDEAKQEASPVLSFGDPLPNMILKNEKGEDIEVTSLVSERGLVLFLVPKADTPGCTKQACGFGDIYQDIKAHFDVCCLSADTPAALTKWQTKKSLPYSLLSDPERVLIKALGAEQGKKTIRSHFIFSRGGTLLDKRVPVKPVESPSQVLEFINQLRSDVQRFMVQRWCGNNV